MSKIARLTEKVDKLYNSKNPNADTWIDWGYVNHVLVVADFAEQLAKAKNANTELILAGALLHDIADAVMSRSSSTHESESEHIARRLLKESGFSDSEVGIIVKRIIKPHSCSKEMPETLEAKVLATADAMAHFTTDFYLIFCWRHYGPRNDYQTFRLWVLDKIEKDYNKKIFFDDIKKQISPEYAALRLLFSKNT